MPALTTSPRSSSSTPATSSIGYGFEICVIMLAAFTLSVVHTVYAWRADLEEPSFTVTSPLAWGFYAVAFVVTASAIRRERWVHWTVTGFLAVVVLIGVFYYPTTFTEAQQTTFGWFENDVYVGLLVLALYLSVMRLRRRSLVP